MNDTLTEFCNKIQLELDNEEIVSLNPLEKFTDLSWWNSMSALVIVAFINTEYGIKFTTAELRNCESLEQVYALIKAQ